MRRLWRWLQCRLRGHAWIYAGAQHATATLTRVPWVYDWRTCARCHAWQDWEQGKWVNN